MSAYVYRAFAADGALLYVGSTVRLGCRMRNHHRTARWWFAAKRFTFVEYATEAEARAAEVEAIGQEFPRWNVHHRSTSHPVGWRVGLRDIARRYTDDDRYRSLRETWTRDGSYGRARLVSAVPVALTS